MSRIHGTRRIHEVTVGQEEDPIRVLEEPGGHHRRRKDVPVRRFGTVRPRVQIPGPRPVFEFRVVVSRLTPGASTTMLCKSGDCDSKAYFRAVT